MQAMAKAMGRIEWGLLVLLSMLWGGSFFFGKLAVAQLPPLSVVLGRVSIAAIALNLLVFAFGHRMPAAGKTWTAFFVMGFLNNLIPFSLIFWGQTQIASGLAAILNSTTPLFTVVLAHFLTQDEKLTPWRISGVGLGMAGVAWMIGVDALSGIGSNVAAQMAVLGAAVSYAFAGIYGRRFRSLPPLVTAAGQVTAATVMMTPLVCYFDRPWTLPFPDTVTVSSVIALALLCTALAYVIYFRILALAGATNLLLVTFLIPVSALVLGIFILGEELEPRHFAGMALIALGLAGIDGRPMKWLARKRQAEKSAPKIDFQV